MMSHLLIQSFIYSFVCIQYVHALSCSGPCVNMGIHTLDAMLVNCGALWTHIHIQALFSTVDDPTLYDGNWKRENLEKTHVQ